MAGSITLIEGVDGVGKTTLVRELMTNKTGVVTFHAGPPLGTSSMREYMLPLVLAGAGWNVICDRWHLGELVWPIIFKREPILHLDDLRKLELAITTIKVPIKTLYLIRPTIDITAERPDMTRDMIQQALDLYELAMGASLFDWRRITMPAAIAEAASHA